MGWGRNLVPGQVTGRRSGAGVRAGDPSVPPWHPYAVATSPGETENRLLGPGVVVSCLPEGRTCCLAWQSWRELASAEGREPVLGQAPSPHLVPHI